MRLLFLMPGVILFFNTKKAIMKNILITGAFGQLGHEIQGLSYTHAYKAYKFFHTGRNNLDITNPEQVKQFF
jgi:dTDP-4-dehydrorhamnose reductase